MRRPSLLAGHTLDPVLQVLTGSINRQSARKRQAPTTLPYEFARTSADPVGELFSRSEGSQTRDSIRLGRPVMNSPVELIQMPGQLHRRPSGETPN